MGLFRPAWKSADPAKRRRAVESLTDQQILKQIAAQDPDPAVRCAALSRVTDDMFLASFAAQIGHCGLRGDAIRLIRSWQVLVQLAAACPKDNLLCVSCFERLPATLPREASALLYRAGGWAALLEAERSKDVGELTRLQGDRDRDISNRARWALEAIEKERQLRSDDSDLQRRILRESDDTDRVLNAADKLHDEGAVFRRLAAEAAGDLEGERWGLVHRLSAKLSDPGYIRRLFALDNDRFRRAIAENTLRRMQEAEPDFVRQVALNEAYDRTVRTAAVEVLTDPALLTEIGLKYPALRYYVIENDHFPDDQRVFAAILGDPEADRLVVEKAAKRTDDPALILRRLAFEKRGELIAFLASLVPELKPYAEDLKTVLGSRPESGGDYGKTAPNPTVTANLRRRADAKLAVWKDAAERLIAFAGTQPEALLPIWDRLDAAVTGAEGVLRFHRWLPNGKSEWDDGAQDFKFSFDQQEWTETVPLDLTFPKKPGETAAGPDAPDGPETGGG